MGKILNIVERAYQGTLEEQDDQALWLVHAMQNAGAEHTILLRGPATAYAVRGQFIGSLKIAGKEAGNPPKLDEDLVKLSKKGVDIYLVEEDAAERGISPDAIISEVKLVSRAGVADLFIQAKHIFAW